MEGEKMGLWSDREKKGIIICGFAGIGKTGFLEHDPSLTRKRVFDLSSSYFRKNEGWEKVYCDIAESLSKDYDYIFLSTHNMVIRELLSRRTKFFLVYPRKHCKDEYIQRFIKRGNSKEYITKFIKNWDNFIQMLDDVKIDNKIELRSGQYLSDVIYRLK